ncbi:MAG: branched-subunit amino acid aminotransferase/4-amino-4-deoxychorismate lyase [Myxococcota bacterium]|jgi:branched-subunit amino acid aminotransferase/4-amino-4-deoxychorismate lyase
MIDGTPPDRARPIEPDDPAITLGISAFETMRTYQQRLPLLPLHHKRLTQSADRLGLTAPPLSTLEEELAMLLEGLPAGEEAAVRITLTGGGRRILRASPAPAPFPTLACALRPWAPVLGLETVKHGSRAGWVVSVRDSGADDVIWLDGSGRLREASCGAVLARVGGRWVSPPDDGTILPSVTIQMLEGLIEIERRAARMAEVEGLWLCSSLKLAAAVASIDGRPVPTEPAAGRRLVAAVRRWAGGLL